MEPPAGGRQCARRRLRDGCADARRGGARPRRTGIDASEPYLDGARRHRSHPDVTYELGVARQMPYADASFDACVSILALDVIPEVDEVAIEMRRVTRPGRSRRMRRI